MEPGGLHGTKLFIGATSSTGHDGTGMSFVCKMFCGCRERMDDDAMTTVAVGGGDDAMMGGGYGYGGGGGTI
jgi:hypothetical protein